MATQSAPLYVDHGGSLMLKTEIVGLANEELGYTAIFLVNHHHPHIFIFSNST